MDFDFVLEMDFRSFQGEFQYFDIYLHRFLVSCLLQHPLPDLVSHVCVITNDIRHFIITNNGLIQAGNELCSVSLGLFEFCSSSVKVN